MWNKRRDEEPPQRPYTPPAPASVPAPAVSGHGALTVAWKGTNGHLWEIRRSGPSWGKPVDRGMGKLGSVPTVTGLASGLVDIFWAASTRP